VAIRHRQQLGLAGGEPVLGRRPLALGTVPVATGVVGDLGVGAVLTSRHVAAERGGAAALDRRHHLELTEAQVAAIGTAPSWPVGAEDIRDLQRATRHRNAPDLR
jgi:hypothetical protein